MKPANKLHQAAVLAGVQDADKTIRATFVMEQHIGHFSFYENLRRFVDPSPVIEANWVNVTYKQPSILGSYLPFLPENTRGSLNGRAQVRRGLHHYPADVVLYNTQVPAALGGRLVRQRPYVLCTDITPIQYDRMSQYYGQAPERSGLFSRYKHHVNRNLFQNAARILPWSTWARDSLIHDYGVLPERIAVAPPGVDIDSWQPKPRSQTDRLRILFIGGDFYRKGGEDLLTAVQLLPPDRVELILVTHSAVPQAQNMTVYNHMQANSPALIALCQSCDLFVLPTRAEAFGIAAVEAGALGLPAIVTAVGGLTDIVIDGQTGFHIAPGDIPALAAHIRRLIHDPALRRQLGQNGRRRVEKQFNARENADRIIHILQQVIAESARKKTYQPKSAHKPVN